MIEKHHVNLLAGWRLEVRKVTYHDQEYILLRSKHSTWSDKTILISCEKLGEVVNMINREKDKEASIVKIYTKDEDRQEEKIRRRINQAIKDYGKGLRGKVKNQQPEEEGAYKCRYCKRIFPTKNRLWQHTKDKHLKKN